MADQRFRSQQRDPGLSQASTSGAKGRFSPRGEDPLAELVKIDPKSIGVGQYQHDVSQTKLARSLEMIANTAPLDVSGHPATSVPAGLSDGLPVGMMIVGRHFADAMCLRVAQAYENAAGGFPAPPGR